MLPVNATRVLLLLKHGSGWNAKLMSKHETTRKVIKLLKSDTVQHGNTTNLNDMGWHGMVAQRNNTARHGNIATH